MKHLRKFNEELDYNDGISSVDDLKEIFNNLISVRVSFEDLLSDTGIIILTKNGKVFEKISNSWKEYESAESFKNETGASLDNEYAASVSKKLLNLIVGDDGDGIDDYRVDDIKAIYFEGEPTNMLKNVLKRY